MELRERQETALRATSLGRGPLRYLSGRLSAGLPLARPGRLMEGAAWREEKKAGNGAEREVAGSACGSAPQRASAPGQPRPRPRSRLFAPPEPGWGVRSLYHRAVRAQLPCGMRRAAMTDKHSSRWAELSYFSPSYEGQNGFFYPVLLF